MRRLILITLLVGLGSWIVVLQRRLEAARLRGDMYRDISVRLDRRIASLTTQEQ